MGNGLSHKNIKKESQNIQKGKYYKPTEDRKYQLLFNKMINSAVHFEVLFNKKNRVVDFKTLEVNRPFEKLSKLTREELIGKRASKVFPMDFSDLFHIAERVIKTRRGRKFEYYSHLFNRWFQMSMFYFQKNECVVVFHDISDLKWLNERLWHNQAILRSVFDAITESALLIDPEGIVLEANSVAAKRLGVPFEKLIGKNLFTILALKESKKSKAFLQNIIQTGEPATFLLEREHDRLINVSAYPVYDTEKQISHFAVFAKDVTEQTHAEARLRESELKFRSIIEQSVDGIALMDDTGTVIESNKSQERMTGLKRSDIVGKKIWDVQSKLFTDERRNQVTRTKYKVQFKEFLKAGNAAWLGKPFESQWQREDGTRITVETIVFPITMGDKHIYGSINRNVTELRQHKKELERRQQELSEQNVLLQEKNIALREVMAQLDHEKKRIGEQVHTNVERFISPLLSQIRMWCPPEREKYLTMLEENLQEITSSFGKHISHKMLHLTQKEVEICNMIRKSLTSKEIARLQNVSPRTIETHRNRIRKKLEIDDPAINLATYLENLT